MGVMGDSWHLIIWFVMAWGSYWLARETDENTTWAPIYGLAWGIFSVAYYSVIYFKHEY